MGKKDKEMLDKLIAEKAKLQRQIEALQNEVRGVERAIALYSNDQPVIRQRPKNVKGTVLAIVERSGPMGVNVEEVVSEARLQGHHLEKPTVASTLSRLKLDGQVTGRDGRYVFRANPTPASGWIEPATVN